MIAALFAAAALLAAPAAAEDAQPPAPPAKTKPAKPAPSPDDVICKAPQVTGSRFPAKKQCLTRRQWDELSSDARETLRNPNPGVPAG